jgi:hypothetical protein
MILQREISKLSNRLEALFAAFDEVFQALREESGIAFWRSPDPPMRHTRNDTFHLIYKGPLPAENSVKVDVTKGETVVFALEQKPVIRTYAEFADLPDDRALLVYSLPEIVVEKTLAVTDDARREPRDLYDLWYIQEDGHCPHAESLVDGLGRKLASRDGRADDVLVPRLERVEKILARSWESRVTATVNVACRRLEPPAASGRSARASPPWRRWRRSSPG